MSTTHAPGVPAPGAVLLALGLGLAGALYDVLTGPGLGLVFAVAFVTGCVAAALVVRRRELAVVVVMPPLAYVVIALVAGAVQGSTTAGSFLVRHALDLFTALVLQAPALMAATGLALLVALARGLGRRGHRPATTSTPAAQHSATAPPHDDRQQAARQQYAAAPQRASAPRDRGVPR